VNSGGICLVLCGTLISDIAIMIVFWLCIFEIIPSLKKRKGPFRASAFQHFIFIASNLASSL
jgi:hypothetical protein